MVLFYADGLLIGTVSDRSETLIRLIAAGSYREISAEQLDVFIGFMVRFTDEPDAGPGDFAWEVIPGAGFGIFDVRSGNGTVVCVGLPESCANVLLLRAWALHA